ncbi:MULTISPECIES: threonine ammonia-lyase, biosynthetic [Rhodanobacter]|uniref:threonine ammonia-lyase, biosynthetic n=1 Tax=Rhodanobacter TaxID=75309 RepID=UPI00040DCFD4|nr:MULTISPECIES: threonine ammonia-lyase, biosynthetic [Rhodanobacter]KZC18531.1 PLP-dependent threonine dehydratase [Rhodanobacter denitrificans]UJJ50802.1 threonine ammonia-lyase, biosynthetic [Rhodanobacter denitrificans]UJJ56998.1 threonine ammonia-lyase, biosynthetic [Rhodanobacter denitrificans]UJM93517.1 threonine ammonia-lyase, biosynthetic [Rhodanobacter denitrificans]UJM97048.1 threonine ammonia-lyase, biosynthetic [Rhodanobacter denitrificans]
MNAVAPLVDDDHADLLAQIRAARVYEVAQVSALEPAPLLGERLGRPVLLKREDQQSVFSFKLRGAYNRMVQLDAAQRARGVVAASAGNHAQGVALAAAKLGIRATIVMPVTAPQLKVDAVRRFGGAMVDVVLAGDSYSDAQAAAAQLQAERGAVFVHPFDDPAVIAGQGTVALEILLQHPGPLEAVFVPVGGGGLAAGVAACIKALRPAVRVIGVQAADSDAMARSLDAGERVVLDEVGLFADGTAVKQVGALTFALCRQHVDAMLRVDADAVCAAIRDIYQDTRSVPEPAGALALAGLKQYAAAHGGGAGALVAIVSGANMNFDRLRFVAERAELGEQREAVFAVTIPEERGSFRRFCAALGRHAITEFNYRIGDARSAHIFVGVRIARRGEREALAAAFRAQAFELLDLTDDELAKLHLRHMIGGRSPLARDERLYRFEFPERPGALTDFLGRLHPDWNVSLFHYRNHGADHGRILVGLQVPAAELPLLRQFLAALGYPHVDESAHPAYRRLLRS